jgi:integrase
LGQSLSHKSLCRFHLTAPFGHPESHHYGSNCGVHKIAANCWFLERDYQSLFSFVAPDVQFGDAIAKLREIPHFPMLKEAPPRTGILEHAEFIKLRAELPEHLRPILTMGYFTGMRLGEILALRWKDVDLHEATIELLRDTTKTAKRAGSRLRMNS